MIQRGCCQPKPQRGAAASSTSPKSLIGKRDGEKRLTLALNGETYRRLRLHAANADRTHQSILEEALAEYLNSVNA